MGENEAAIKGIVCPKCGAEAQKDAVQSQRSMEFRQVL